MRKLYVTSTGIALAWGVMSDLTKVQWILLLNFVALPLHQFEEYGWPGGFPELTTRSWRRLVDRLIGSRSISERRIDDQLRGRLVVDRHQGRGTTNVPRALAGY